MAPEVKAQPDSKQARRQQIEAEWAQVSLCAGMRRMRNQTARASRAAPEIDREDWQPNQRCCP